MGAIEIKAGEMTELLNAQTAEVRAALKASPQSMKELVQGELLRRAILAEWDKRSEVAVAMERAKDQAVIDNFLNTRSQPEAAYPTVQELQSVYESNKAQFEVPPQIRIAQILIRLPKKASADETAKAGALARELGIKLEKGGDFAALARLSSQDEASKEKGGELGWLAETALTPQIRTKLSGLKAGGVGW